MKDCNPACASLASSFYLILKDAETMIDATPYRPLVGSLLHLSNTVRPKLSFSDGLHQLIFA